MSEESLKMEDGEELNLDTTSIENLKMIYVRNIKVISTILSVTCIKLRHKVEAQKIPLFLSFCPLFWDL